MLLALAVVLLLPPMSTQAATVEDLHSARVQVHGQDAEERQKGFREALRDVIVRVTGRSDVVADPELESVLEWPGEFVQSFRYQRIDEVDRDQGVDDAPTHYLDVTFAGGRVNNALTERDIPVWGVRRPEVLLWVGVDDGSNRYLVGSQDGADARAALRESARTRGLPLLFPLLDVEDQQRVDFIDVQGGFVEALEAAGERYRADAMLIGHVALRGGEWRAEWTLILGDQRQRWQVIARSRDDALAAGVAGSTDRLAAALVGDEVERLQLALLVRDVDSLSDYARVSAYLNSLVRVRSAELERLTADSARFWVRFDGRIDELQRAITLDSVLVPAPPAPTRENGGGLHDTATTLDDFIESLLDEGPVGDVGDGPSEDPDTAPGVIIEGLDEEAENVRISEDQDHRDSEQDLFGGDDTVNGDPDSIELVYRFVG